MKAKNLIEYYKNFAITTEDLFGVSIELVGPASLEGKNFENAQGPFRHAKGVYMITDNQDNILYIGMSQQNSIGHRIFKRIEKVENGDHGNVLLSSVYGIIPSKPEYSILYEKVGLSLVFKSDNKRPIMNKRM